MYEPRGLCGVCDRCQPLSAYGTVRIHQGSNGRGCSGGLQSPVPAGGAAGSPRRELYAQIAGAMRAAVSTQDPTRGVDDQIAWGAGSPRGQLYAQIAGAMRAAVSTQDPTRGVDDLNTANASPMVVTEAPQHAGEEGDVDSPEDPASVKGLRRMKMLATGWLLFAAVLYVTSLNLHSTVGGFIRAGSEAAMVGGIADWFAVTALFRRPLGLPIPHTALIPRQKDEIARKLGSFVTGHFLTRKSVTQQVARAALVPKFGAWLADSSNATRLATEGAHNAGAMLEVLEDEAVVGYVLELIRRDAARRSYAPVLGRLLEWFSASGSHEPLVQVLARAGHEYIRKNKKNLAKELLPLADGLVPWGLRWWLAPDEGDLARKLEDVADMLQDVERKPQNDLRRLLDSLLEDLATKLLTDAGTAEQIKSAASRLLADERIHDVLHEVVADGLDSIRQSLADPEGELQSRIAILFQQVGHRIRFDGPFSLRIERALKRVVGHAVDRYGSELTELIRSRVAEWDPKHASRKIELAIGRDLQFIRINGTVVGALAGLTIHGLTKLGT